MPKSPASQFRRSADALQKRIDFCFQDRLENTPRRADIADGLRKEGRSLKKLQDRLRSLADAWDDDAVPVPLKDVSTKSAVEWLARGWYPKAGDANALLAKAGIASEVDYFAAVSALEKISDPDAGEKTKADLIKEAENALVGLKIDGYFPTPPEVVRDMLSHIVIEPDDTILEPSAGKGNIADVIREMHPDNKLSVVEIVPRLRKLLEYKGHTLIADDIFDVTEQFDVIVANPPFEKLADIDHVSHYWNLLKPGGRLVTIMSESPFFRKNKKAQAFRDWFDDNGGDSRNIGAAFKNGERPTGVNVRIAVIIKPGDKPAPQPASQPAKKWWSYQEGDWLLHVESGAKGRIAKRLHGPSYRVYTIDSSSPKRWYEHEVNATTVELTEFDEDTDTGITKLKQWTKEYDEVAANGDKPDMQTLINEWNEAHEAAKEAGKKVDATLAKMGYTVNQPQFHVDDYVIALGQVAYVRKVDPERHRVAVWVDYRERWLDVMYVQPLPYDEDSLVYHKTTGTYARVTDIAPKGIYITHVSNHYIDREVSLSTIRPASEDEMKQPQDAPQQLAMFDLSQIPTAS